MKSGRTLAELAAEVDRQANTKRDFLVSTADMRMVAVNGFDDAARAVEMEVGDQLAFGVNHIGHRQVGEFVDVPGRYYDHMLAQAPELLATNVNHWLHKKAAKRQVRTLDGNMRAFLSDRFRNLENYDLAQVALPVLAEVGIQVLSCEVTESRLYIKGVDNRCVRTVSTKRIVDGQLVTSDDVCPTVCLSNSEVGMGALSIDVGAYTHRCKNMALFTEASLRKYHVGGRNELGMGDVVRELLTDQTKAVTDTATWLQVRDVIRAAFDPAKFEANIKPMQEATEQKLDGNPVKVVEMAARRFNLVGDEFKSVLRHLIEGGDLSRYGVFNAITRAAEDATSYDRATELERTGGQVLVLPANDWKAIASAA